MHLGVTGTGKALISDGTLIKPTRCVLISVWALSKWSLYSSTSIEARHGISVVFKQKTQNKVSLRWKRAGGDGTSQGGRPSVERLMIISADWQVTDAPLMHCWSRPRAHWPVNWLSSAKHLAHQTTRTWPDLVQNTHSNYLLGCRLGEL